MFYFRYLLLSVPLRNLKEASAKSNIFQILGVAFFFFKKITTINILIVYTSVYFNSVSVINIFKIIIKCNTF